MKNIKGFTLVEVIVVVAVLAVVLTIATPDINRLFSKQSEITETLRLKKIYKALDIYAKKNKKLPSSASWAEELAEYSDLSIDQVKNDTWGTPRDYETFTEDMSYLGGTYKVYYAVLTSNGLDRVTNGETLPTNKSAFANFDFTVSLLGRDNDNMAIKYTDQANKIALLEETLRRMEKLSIVLAKYARVKQIEGISDNDDKSDQKIYFPKDKRSTDSAAGSGAANKYHRSVGEIDGNENEATGLATMLGLPSYYGENALTDSTMWYISNPGPDGSDICSGERSEAPFYPPVIMIDDSGNPC